VKQKTIRTTDGRKAVIRPLKPGDADLLFQCFQGFGAIARKNFAPHPFSREIAEDICSRIDTDTANARFLVTQGPDEVPLGYAFISKFGDDVPFLGIGLIDTATGVGLGRKVVQFLLSHGRAAGYAKLALSVMVRNARARALYESLGFTYLDGQVWDENGEGWSLRMEKVL